MRKNKIKVAVLMGGPSSEHGISLKTGEMILKNLNLEKFEAFPVKIDQDGNWPITIENLKEKTDVAFIAMHGEYGEDGQIQSLLETFDIPYTGSDPITSSIAMDKQKTAELLSRNGLLIPESIALAENDIYIDWVINKRFQSPIIIKPADCGSSIGLSLVTSKNKLKEAVNKAFDYSKRILAQQYIKGKEVTCGVLEINNVPIPLPPTEIIPNRGILFDFDAKYDSRGSTEITPPNLQRKIIKDIQMIALKVHKLLGCSGMSRTDMILQEDGNIYILELNTIPGMTETSLLPQQAKKIGIDFPQLLEIIINSALNKYA